jgi:hypothetical protein
MRPTLPLPGPQRHQDRDHVMICLGETSHSRLSRATSNQNTCGKSGAGPWSGSKLTAHSADDDRMIQAVGFPERDDAGTGVGHLDNITKKGRTRTSPPGKAARTYRAPPRRFPCRPLPPDPPRTTSGTQDSFDQAHKHGTLVPSSNETPAARSKRGPDLARLFVWRFKLNLSVY